jgi:hypothetical protein
MSDFTIGQTVFKWTGDYTGPGIVRGIAQLGNGKVRYLVGHRLGGGEGELLHVYAEGNLRAISDQEHIKAHAEVIRERNDAVLTVEKLRAIAAERTEWATDAETRDLHGSAREWRLTATIALQFANLINEQESPQ